MTGRVRIGIIGTGQIGKAHIRTYKETPDCEMVAVADLREDEARRVAQEYGIPHVYTDYHDLLSRTDIDSVDVCLHNRLHRPVTIDALNAGKHVYCEKPISWTYQDGQAMYDAARSLGRMLHVQMRTVFTPNTRAAKRLIDEGHLGEIYYAKACHYRRRGRPFVDGYGTNAFVNTDTSGGGAMLDMAVYHISQMLFLLGNPRVRSVSGSTSQMLDNMYEDRRVSSGYDVEEMGLGLIRLDGGVTFLMEEAWAIHSGPAEGDLVFGSKGGLRVDPLAYWTTLADMEMDATFDLDRADWRWNQVDPATADYAETQRQWIAAQLGRVPLIDTAGIALNTAFITEGIYISSHLGREVTAEEIETAEPGLGRA